MDDIADFVLTPFREIVEKGQTAVENAGDTQPMLKASQSLVKEGERALKKIEPLCKKHLEEYGSNFLEAIKANGKLSLSSHAERAPRLNLCNVMTIADFWWQRKSPSSEQSLLISCGSLTTLSSWMISRPKSLLSFRLRRARQLRRSTISS